MNQTKHSLDFNNWALNKNKGKDDGFFITNFYLYPYSML